MNKIKLFTHGADLDGIGCAILAYLAFGRENVDVEYCNYDDVDEKVEELLSNSDLRNSYDKIFITDISISEELAKAIDIWINPFNIRLFDHHATALGLNKYDWCYVSVDSEFDGIKTSGTELFFKYLLCNGLINNISNEQDHNLWRFVQIVRNYDTWRWKELGDEGIVCKQVNDLFHIYGREEFIEWAIDEITKPFVPRGNVEPIFPYFYDCDKALLEQKQKDIDRYVEQKNKQLTAMKDPFGYTCGVVFAEQYFSELGNRLCEMHPEIDYVAMVNISDGTVSYRSTRDDLDLGGEIAHSFGGGGHKKAAGSVFDGSAVRNMIVSGLFITDEEKNRIVNLLADTGNPGYLVSAEDLKKVLKE